MDIMNFDVFSPLNESKNKDITYEEKENMISISEMTTNIKDVVMWIGKNNIRVSNIPNNKKVKNCFTIKIPSLSVSGYVDGDFITSEKMNNILSFIKNNIGVINMYFNNDFDTSEFIKKLKNNMVNNPRKTCEDYIEPVVGNYYKECPICGFVHIPIN